MRLARPARPAAGAGRGASADCGRLDPVSSPGALAPVAAVAALGPDLPDLPAPQPLVQANPTYGPRNGRLEGFAPPKGFFLDRYVY